MANRNEIASHSGAMKVKHSGGKAPELHKVRSEIGLSLKVYPSGTKSLIFTWRRGSKKTRVTFVADLKNGREGQEAFAAACARARRWQEWIKQDFDPREVERAETAATVAGATVLKPEKTFGFLVRLYMRSRKKLTTSTVKRNQRLAKRAVFETPLGSKPLSEVTLDDLSAAVARETHSNAEILSQLLSQTLKFGRKKKLIGFTATAEVLRDDDPDDNTKAARVEQEQAGEKGARHLLDDEIVKVWEGCDAVGYPAGPWFKLMLLTGLRRKEAGDLRWDEIEFDDEGREIAIHLSAVRTKAGRSHRIPMTDEMREVLQECRIEIDGAFVSRGDYVFASPKNGKPIGGYTYWTNKIIEKSGVEDWSAHSMRKTSTTSMQMLGVDPALIERCHNRVGDPKSGVPVAILRAYYRHDYREEMEEAFALHCKRIAALFNPPEEGNVVTLRRAG